VESAQVSEQVEIQAKYQGYIDRQLEEIERQRHHETLRLPGGLDRLARDIASTLPAGSSAGGEQPKFLATLDRDRHVLVKFTPPRATPFGDRWHDLLWAEWLAGRVLQAHGFEVAQAQVVSSATRTYLVSERFDRIGTAGRRHVLSIGDVHRAFVADAYSHWAATAGELRRRGRLRPPDAQRASALLGFGRLIGNPTCTAATWLVRRSARPGQGTLSIGAGLRHAAMR
jgi:hypothetical protein